MMTPVPGVGEANARAFSDGLFELQPKGVTGIARERTILLAALPRARQEPGLEQAQVAERMGIRAPAELRSHRSAHAGAASRVIRVAGGFGRVPIKPQAAA
jgi:hypothetical protein